MDSTESCMRDYISRYSGLQLLIIYWSRNYYIEEWLRKCLNEKRSTFIYSESYEQLLEIWLFCWADKEEALVNEDNDEMEEFGEDE